MPMDIRNFFGAKKAVKKKHVASSNNDDDKKNKNRTKKQGSKPESSSRKVVNIDDDDEDSFPIQKTRGKSSKLKANDSKKDIVLLDDDDDYETKHKDTNYKSKYFRKPPSSLSQGREKQKAEVSAEDYFNDSTETKIKDKKASSKGATGGKRKHSKSRRVLDDDSDHDNSSDEDFEMEKESLSSDEDLESDGDSKRRAKLRRGAYRPSGAKKAKKQERVKDGRDEQEELEEDREEHSPKIQKRGGGKLKPTPTKKQKLTIPSSKPLQPGCKSKSFDVDSAESECLSGYTFVFSGVLETMSRDESQDFVKMLGGRVTSAVSSKTSYLVVGELLEDGRPHTEGSKYKKAVGLRTVQIVQGEEELYGLAKLYNDKAKEKTDFSTSNSIDSNVTSSVMKAAELKKGNDSAGARASKPVNPYTKRASNPYARANPYQRSNPYAKASSRAVEKDDEPKSSKSTDPTMLWVDKYAPQSTREILGNKENVTKLATWLARWEGRFNAPDSVGKSFSNPNGPFKAALLSGPPGIGKTTTATLVIKESGRDLLEFNASDVRSKKALKDSLGDITGSNVVQFGKVGKKMAKKKRAIIMDEVDGMGGGDRGGMAELIQMIKSSRVPIICICNDRQSQKMKSLLPYCLDLRFRRPVKSAIASQAIKVAAREGLKVERNAAEAIAESCGNDVRQVLNCLHMWASDNKNKSVMSYKQLKERETSIKKDEILRVSLFDAAKLILEGRKGLSGADAAKEKQSFYKRNEAFFVDHSFVGLLVQQNYTKVMQAQHNEAKRRNDPDEILSSLDRMYDAASTMSDFALAESAIHGIDQNWSLLPFSASLAVKAGYHASGHNGGFFPGFPEFTSWMGKNSTKGKKNRILQELRRHMNFKISGGTDEARLSYLPFVRQHFLSILKSDDKNSNSVAIELMDQYGFDRDDVFENLDEFKMDSKADSFADIDSKRKAAFTREYNKGSHMSQALVEEQGNVGNRKKNVFSSKSQESFDPDVINEDMDEESEDEDALDDLEAIKASFKKKGRKTNTKKKVKVGGKRRGKN